MPAASWPWAVLAGLGLYHGLNPAMGWLFAVALGLHRGSRAIVLLSLLPIAAGHALAIATVLAVVVVLGSAVDQRALQWFSGIMLIGWAVYHASYGARHRARVGMRAGMAGLFLWSFLAASAHGAGLMLIPAVTPLCFTNDLAGARGVVDPAIVSVLAVGVHTTAMLSITAIVAVLVYDVLGVGFLRRGWLNLDRIWTGALCLTGLALLYMPYFEGFLKGG